MDTQDLIRLKYEELKAASGSQDIDTINGLVVQILTLLHKQWGNMAGTKKYTYEEAYCLVDHTYTVHQQTKQDTTNSNYLNEIGLQIGRDLQPVLSSINRSAKRRPIQ